MGSLRVVVRIGALWVVSLVVSAVGLEIAHRFVLTTERDATMHAAAEKARTLNASTDVRF